MPALAVAISKNSSTTCSPATLSALKAVDNLLSRAMSLSASRMAPSKLRNIALQTATLRTLQSSIGKFSKRSAGEVAAILGTVSSKHESIKI
jgi:separase